MFTRTDSLEKKLNQAMSFKLIKCDHEAWNIDIRKRFNNNMFY